MDPPGHEMCLHSQKKTNERNRMYLTLIFEHSATLCAEVLQSCGGNYAAAYDELVRREGHGTPGGGSVRFNGGVPVLLLPVTERGRGMVEESRRRRLERADELVDGWKRLNGPVRMFWEEYWKGSYRGFRDAQRELGKLRDDIGRGEFVEGVARHTLDYLKGKLNEMLIASIKQWYLKWGEIDLHRLSYKDAVDVLWALLRQPAWREMRVVAGQRQHTGDHRSEGVLYGLIHCVFGGGEVLEDGVVKECARIVRENDVDVKFYSNGAAVWLRKKRKKRERPRRVGERSKL